MKGEKSVREPGAKTTGLVLVSVKSLRNADAKRPGMHSNAKRWNEVERAWPK